MGEPEISPVLLTRLVNDVGDNPDQLSILQHALNRTWARWQHEGRGQGSLDLPDYEGIGTMAHALDRHAEKAYEELGSERTKCCEKIFKALTDKGTDPRGIRRPTEFKALCALANANPAEVIQVIDAFRKPSRSFLLPPLPELLKPDTVIDISHESLMRVWDRLKHWADEEAQSAQMYRRLSETAALYESGKAGLWRDPELQLTLDWREREKPTATWAGLYRGNFQSAMAFLAQSEAIREKEIQEKRERENWELQQARILAEEQTLRAEEQARAARRLRWLALAMAVFLVAAVLAAVFAVEKKEAAEDATAQAVTAKTDAEKAKTDAEKAKIAADAAETTAIKDANIATVAQKDAEEQANRAEHEARRNLSHELAGASLIESQPDPEFSLLLALEAVTITYEKDKTVEREAEEALQRAVQASQPKPFSSGHTGEVHSVAFSPDGKRVATAGLDGTARVWDAASGLCLFTLSGHTGAVWAVAFSPDGRRLATAGDDHTVKVWHASSGEQVRSLPHNSVVWSVAFSPDGGHLATGGQDGTAKIWNLVDPSASPLIFTGHTDAVRAVAFSPDGYHLATASQDGTAKVWVAADPKMPPSTFPPGQDGGPINALAFSPDKIHLATAGNDGKVTIWDTAVPTKPPQILNGTNPVWAVAFSPDGKHLGASGSNDRIATIWDLSDQSHHVELTMAGHAGTVWAAAFSPDGRWVGTAGGYSDRIARIWDASSGQELVELSDLSIKESVLALSSDGRLVAAYGYDGSLRLWDGMSGLELFTLLPQADTKRILLAAFSPGGRYLGAISSDGSAHVWETSGGQEVHHSFPVRGAPAGLALSPDGGRLATIIGKVLTVWDVSSGRPSTEPWNSTAAANPPVSFSPDGRLLATSAGRKVTLWDIRSGTALHDLSHAGTVSAVSFSADSKRLATASLDSTVRLWNAQSGEELHSLQFQANGVYDIAFSPDGTKLATLSRDGYLKLWQVGSPEELLSFFVELPLHGQRLASHPDGDLITADNNMVVREYPLSISELMAFARRHVSRSWTADECNHYLHEERCQSETVALAYIAEGNNLSRVGKDSAADSAPTASFRKAQELDPSLQLDAKEEIRGLRAEALLANGRTLASAGDWNGALTKFQKALDLDPELHFNPQEAARHLAAPAFVGKGRNLARAGDLNGTVGSFLQAKELDPSLSLAPEMEADKLVAQGLAAKGIILANSGDIDGATKTFKEAESLYSPDPGRTNGETAALRQAGESLAKQGHVDRAIQAFQSELDLDPKLKLEPPLVAANVLWQDVTSKAMSGSVDAAIQTFEEARDLAKSLPLDPATQANRLTALNELCWKGSVGGQAARVIDYCELAVQLSGTNNWDIRDSRGLARALTGKTEGAIEDFQFFANHTTNPVQKAQRQKWIDALNRGANPFTRDELQTLINQ